MDLEIHQSLFLDHIKSQWLTLLPALETILAQLPAAEKYFFDFLPHKKGYEKTLPNNKWYIRIQHLLKNENTLKIQMCFVTFIYPPFTDFFLSFAVNQLRSILCI